MIAGWAMALVVTPEMFHNHLYSHTNDILRKQSEGVLGSMLTTLFPYMNNDVLLEF